jgi:uncharacterized membrane protein YkoI
MNTKQLTMNQKILAVIIGVAIFATAGVSVASAQVQGLTGQTGQTGQQPPKIQGTINIGQLLLSNVKTSFTDAANTAATATGITNGKVIGGSLTMAQGFLVYKFQVIDGNSLIYSVIIDPSNGSVLYTSPGHAFQLGALGMGHAGGMKGGHHMGGYGANSQKVPSGSTTPSSGLTTPSGSQS